MKSIFATIFGIFCSISVIAANLTATSTSTGTGVKTGKINLTITGGFAPYTIIWTGPSGYSSTKLNPDSLAAGTYCVTVTDQYCGVAKLCVTVNEQSASIGELSPILAKIYPNPFQNDLFIELESQMLKGNLNCTLFDQSGKLVAEQKMQAQKLIHWHLNVSLATGVYMLNIQSENGQVLRRQVSIVQ